MMLRANYTYVLRLLGIYEIEGRTECKYGLVMEYMPYGSVYTLFHRIDNVPWGLRFQILHQVALGMNYLHHVLQPLIIHRDLKPHNVLLNKFLDVQLTDFGLAKNEASVSSNQSIVGTLSYMPPEAIESMPYKPTKEFDIYSFAIFTWSVLSGQEPYQHVDRKVITMLLLLNQKSRPDMELVNLWTSQKMVPEAIELMQECWDGDPGKRPSFSAIIERTNEMNAAYVDVIDSEIINVLNQLKQRNSSHSQTSSRSDCVRTDPKPSVPDSDTFSINIFREILNRAERGEPSADVSDEDEEDKDSHTESDSPKTSSPDIVDAADFLQSNLSHIVQAKPDLNEVLDILFTRRTISQEELDTIKVGSAHEQIRKTLHLMIRNGPESCMEFIQVMDQLHVELMTFLKDIKHQVKR
ncbi:hypothetical protein GDO81_025726 [Engystomops pustulosus]|uniref:Receptor-interacting serine/threonine-protein kinase 2 n=1 Tax=Engystomops pustulosus TaxID=76066 RepID=A0AAV6Z3L8_ENGPU|nr:hypothetical protein GDO81_025726 [Engystomops pustulosus]